MRKGKFKIALAHLKTICTHKKWVYYYCKHAGITWRGIKHDLSKFSPTEFRESILYYTGTSSPIDAAKKDKGVSYAWMHHKGRNDHHYEYWVDNLDKGGNPIRMPYECAVEMICDFLGAGKAYNGDKFSYVDELEWFINKMESRPAMHKQTIIFVYLVMVALAKEYYYLEDSITGKSIDETVAKSCLNERVLARYYNISCNISERDFEIVCIRNRQWLEKIKRDDE